jgi:hypothetical protein
MTARKNSAHALPNFHQRMTKLIINLSTYHHTSLPLFQLTWTPLEIGTWKTPSSKKKDLYILVWGMVRSKSFCDVKVVKVEDNQARLIAQHLCAK